MFKLDARLQQDTVVVGRFDLSLLLLHKDSNYPWFILVPQRADACEIQDLSKAEQRVLLEESDLTARALLDVFMPDKLNIAMLGNIVSQLHIHHVARFETDVSWPGPIWGAAAAGEYDRVQRDERVARMRKTLVGYLTVV